MCELKHQIRLLAKAFYLPPCVVRVLQRSLKLMIDGFIYLSSRNIEYYAYELRKHVTYLLFILCSWGRVIGHQFVCCVTAQILYAISSNAAETGFAWVCV